ncbi:TetR/AcrR family transcriptional regulator [uncultured Flavobacterium sp.]|uniref:TetR/AcrR family transcriptional regulator n=1 Tax=uncultured Flavobacterium sp. TaxID=165435 RepID=UPI00261A54C2|nr:TetR/AcrR family transcriptional regulator [uncultured Flavobacterium sp.]
MTIKNEISNRQLEIIEVSGKILIEKGIKGLTTKTVASEMNFSESAIYRHFKSKEEILVALLSLLKQNMNKRLTSEIKPQNTSAENFKAVFTSQFNYFKKNPHFVVAVLSDGLLDESEEIRTIILQLMQNKMQLLAQILEQGKQTNEFTSEISTEDLLPIILGSFRFQMLKWKLSNFQYDITTEGNKTIDNLLALIQK